jgi:hypothetical protein
MQRSFLILSCCILVLLSCKKRADAPFIFRQWTWENSVGGFTGRDTLRPPAGGIITLTINLNRTYTTQLNGQVISQGSFQLLRENNETILRLSNYTQTGMLTLQTNGTAIQTGNNALHLTDYDMSEPYTHHFK